jgi:hypothetical protein
MKKWSKRWLRRRIEVTRGLLVKKKQFSNLLIDNMTRSKPIFDRLIDTVAKKQTFRARIRIESRVHENKSGRSQSRM